MDIFFAIGVGAYGATTAGYLASLWSPRPALGEVARWLLTGTLVFWAVLLVAAANSADPVSATRVWLGLSAWSLGALYLVLLRRYPVVSLGSFVTALATVLAVLSLLVSGDQLAADAVPGWILRVHIGMAFIGITAFAFATAVSLVFLLQSRMIKSKSHSTLRSRLPPLDVLDGLALRGIIVGFPFYTLALLLGSVQAVRAGAPGVRATYLVALASWVIYGAVLQARLTAGWRGRRAAILTTVGFFAALVVVAGYSLRGA